MARSAMYRHLSPSESISSKPLKRGKACLTCRFLKIRCDGTKPICGPCQRSPKDDPCEYADGPGRSRTRVLEETVSRLEARLREYEHPEETPPVALHNPYDQGHESDSTVRVSIPHSSIHSSPSSPYSVTSQLSAASSPHPGGSSGSSERRASVSPAVDNGDKYRGVKHLLDSFFAHASLFGFFLNISRFYNSALAPPEVAPQSRPCPGLLSSVYLWGVHLSPQVQHKEHERTALLRALRDTAMDLVASDTHPHHVMHTIQAETLLGYYFFRVGNILEAKRHASSAASLALGSGLNAIRSTNGWNSNSSYQRPLHESQDVVEEGERINGFWAVFTLYRNLAVAVDPPGSVCGLFDAPGCQIDTPWPFDMESYKEGLLPSRSSSTVYDFLNHVRHSEDEHQAASMCKVVTRASILLHQATFIAGQYNPNMPARDTQSFYAAFQSLKHLIETLHARLPPLAGLEVGNPSTRVIFHAHALVLGSSIRLHQVLADSDPNSRHTCLNAAQSLLRGGRSIVMEFGPVNPIMGTLWSLACQTLIDGVMRTRSVRGTWSPHSLTLQQGQEDDMLATLQDGLSALSYFSADSAMMKYELTKTQGALLSIR